MQKTVLITGITGFLGSNLAVALIKKGYKIIALKRKLSSLARIENILDDLTLYDIEDLDFSIPFKNHGKINAVIHTATSYGRNGETPWQVFEANTGFPLRLLDAASVAGVDSFINTDTILDKYLNLYSLSKNQLLDWGRFYSMHNKIKFVNMRLEHFYGPEDDDSKFTTYVMKSCIDNIEQIKLTAGEQKRDFIYIDDVVSAYLKVIEKIDHIADVFNEFDLGSGNSISIREFVEAVHRITKSRTFLNFGATPYRVGEVMFSQANIAPLKNLGWQCEYTLDRGLLKVIERFK